MKIMLYLFTIFYLVLPLRAEIVSETIEYTQDGTIMEGYLAYDSSIDGLRPGVLVVHEWKGLNDYARMRARMLAELGYIAFACDIYGKGVRPQSISAAAEQSGKYKGNRELLRARVNAGLKVLRENKLSDDNRLAAIGYCFGGTTVLELARSGADIDGVVSFHGGLDSPDPDAGKNIKCRVLVCHGADDPYESSEDLSAFQNEMRQGNVDWQMNFYGNAVHGFTNPEAGDDHESGYAYTESADKRSWRDMKIFFNEIFK